MSKEPVVIKLQIHPGLEEARILDGQSKICNWLYNHLEVDPKVKTKN
jgi:hypothetical protein